MLLISSIHTFAIVGLKISVQHSNVVLSWPSTPGDTYIVQYRPTLSPTSSWLTLTSSLPADATANVTFFVHSNVVQNLSRFENDSFALMAVSDMAPMSTAVADSGTDPTNAPDADPGFYQVVKIGATLYGLTNGITISDIAEFPVEVAQPSGQLMTVTVEDSGIPVGGSIHVAPFERPVPLMVLDTTLMSNGVHSISVHAQWTDNGAIYEASSPAVSVTVWNEISFPNWISEFGELGNSLLVTAQSAHTNAQWYLDVYDSQYYYIGTLGGTTSDGSIYIVWNLIGPDDTLHMDNTFEFVLTTVYSGTSSLTDSPVPQAGGESSRMVPPMYRVTDPWNGSGDWAVANQQAWENYQSHELLDTMTDGFAQMAQDFSLTVRPVTFDQTAYRIGFNTDYESIDWFNFRTAIYNDLSRNLFYLGHGSPEGLGYDQSTTNKSILATEIGAKLHTIPAGQTNKHKYRFVCLDGCSTASGLLCDAFGIIHKSDVKEIDYYYSSVRPSAFVGWDSDKSAGFAGTAINTSHPNYFAHFGYAWTTGYTLKAAFDRAGTFSDTSTLTKGDLKIFGCWTLGPNTFNQ